MKKNSFIDTTYFKCNLIFIRSNKSFTIDDPKHNEQLIVKIADHPGREFAEIEAMRYHERIIARQRLSQLYNL